VRDLVRQDSLKGWRVRDGEGSTHEVKSSVLCSVKLHKVLFLKFIKGNGRCANRVDP
jgi:hypothetical protein